MLTSQLAEAVSTLAILKKLAAMTDLQRLKFHTRAITIGHTFCALAPGAMEPLQSALKLFEEDFHRVCRTHGYRLGDARQGRANGTRGR